MLAPHFRQGLGPLATDAGTHNGALTENYYGMSPRPVAQGEEGGRHDLWRHRARTWLTVMSRNIIHERHARHGCG
ncbi:MAG: hypothetical protein QOI25_1840 [Mycobacterium sp.]|nr:hypothetical protein [Mycobacterium sp.]